MSLYYKGFRRLFGYSKIKISGNADKLLNELVEKKINHVIREKNYEFTITTAVCKECGEEMDVEGIMDLNIKEIEYLKQAYNLFLDMIKRENKNLTEKEVTEIEQIAKIHVERQVNFVSTAGGNEDEKR